ncbi:MAG: Gfo/Idh/MocA family oxidoreductase [Clostridia bacterium]|nr:Gfo/Idh/MocA family oxidoreductase [Clostridia bacterium]
MLDKILSQFKPEEEKAPAEVKQVLKAGIIGAGWIATSYAEPLHQLPNVQIVAICDLIPGKAEKFAKNYGFDEQYAKERGFDRVRFYGSHKEMIDNEPELDVAFVCTYNATHAECCIYALDHGLHVLCEKPFTVTLDEAVEVCRAEKRSGKVLSIGFQPRMDDNMQMIKKIVDSGELGKVYYIQTGGGRRLGIPGSTFIEQKTAGIGALGDIGCYSLDLVLNAIGYPKPLTVSGYTSGFFGNNPKYVNEDVCSRFDVDDFGAGFIRLEGGVILDFRISWAMNLDTPGDTIILGTEGGLRIPSTECWNGSFDKPMTVYKHVAGEDIEYQVPLKTTPESIFLRKIRSFLEAAATGGEAPVPARQILYNQAIIDGICRSARLGHEIELDIPDVYGEE